MGLDQNIMRLPKGVNPEGPVLSWDYLSSGSVRGETKSLGYWRRCYDLDDWMERLFLARGGATEGGGRWSDVGLVLSLEDLKILMEEILIGNLFGYGEDEYWWSEETIKDTVMALLAAAKAIRDGYTVYYTSSR